MFWFHYIDSVMNNSQSWATSRTCSRQNCCFSCSIKDHDIKVKVHLYFVDAIFKYLTGFLVWIWNESLLKNIKSDVWFVTLNIFCIFILMLSSSGLFQRIVKIAFKYTLCCIFLKIIQSNQNFMYIWFVIWNLAIPTNVTLISIFESNFFEWSFVYLYHHTEYAFMYFK